MVLYLAIFSCIKSYEQGKNYNVRITFIDSNHKIKNGEDIFIRLIGVDGDSISSKSKIINNSVVLTGYVSHPSIGMLQTKNENIIKGTKILLENSDYRAVRDLDSIQSDMHFVTSSTFYNEWRDFVDSYLLIDKQKRKLIDTNLRNTDNKVLSDSIIKYLDDLEAQKDFLYLEYASKYPNNYATPYLLTGNPRLSKQYWPLYNNFSPIVKQSYWGKELFQLLSNLDSSRDFNNIKSQIVGKPLPHLVGINSNGDSVIIDASTIIKNKNKITIIDFWASWCQPCRIANIDFLPTYFQNKNKGLNVISFSLDTDKKSWLKAINDDKIPWTVISDLLGNNSPVNKDFQIYFLPTNVIVNNKGIVIGTNVFEKSQIELLLNQE